MVATSTFEGIRATLAYWTFYIKPLVDGLLNLTPREQAVLGLLYRAIGYAASLRKLDAPIHVQAVAASARSLFELGLDMSLFVQDQTSDSFARLAAFTRVERYRVAKKVVGFYTSRSVPQDFTSSVAQQRAHVADTAEAAEVEALVEQYWGTNRQGNLNWPKHWSAFPEARGRAQHVGGPWEERYVQYYFVLSWHIHSGLTGVASLPAAAFDVIGAQAHRLSVDVILDCYKIAGAELRLDSAIQGWRDHLEFLEHAVGLALVDSRLRACGEPTRFLYLESHERNVV